MESFSLKLRAKSNWAEWKSHTLTSILPSNHLAPTTSTHLRFGTAHLVEWRLLVGGFTKLNFDGSKSPIGAVMTFVIHSWTWNVIKGGTRFIEYASVLVAKATTLWDDTKVALGTHIQYLEVEGDNQIAKDAINGLSLHIHHDKFKH